MLNQIVVVGRITKIEKNKIEISVPRSDKNEDGSYKTDIIDFEISGTLENQTKEILKVEDLVGIKGRLQTGNKIVAEKLTFLSSKKTEQE